MNKILGQFILVIILLVSASNAIESADCPVGSGHEHSDGILSSQMQQNYQSSFDKLLNFFESTNSALATVNEKLDRLQSDNAKIKGVLVHRNPEDFLSLLPSPAKGDSFNGSTFQAISAALPDRWSVAVEIKNYLNADLTDYQLGLEQGLKLSQAPNVISAKTVEVATFTMEDPREYEGLRERHRSRMPSSYYEHLHRQTVQEGGDSEVFEGRLEHYRNNRMQRYRSGPPNGVMAYRIGGTNISLHLYFYLHYNTFAAALLPQSGRVGSISDHTCSRKNYVETNGTHRCMHEVSRDRAETMIVHEGNIYVKVTLQNISPRYRSTNTMTAEVFKFPM